MRTDHPSQISLLLESSSGVMEVFFATLENEDDIAIYPVGSIPRSGTVRSTSRQQLSEAFSLAKWCRNHSKVFEGRVSE